MNEWLMPGMWQWYPRHALSMQKMKGRCKRLGSSVIRAACTERTKLGTAKDAKDAKDAPVR